MNKKSFEELKSRKSNKGFFSKLWKVGSPQLKDDKKRISRSADSLNSISVDENVENLKNSSENRNNSLKSKSLDILNDVEEINVIDNIESSDENVKNKDKTKDETPATDNTNNFDTQVDSDSLSINKDNSSFHTSIESTTQDELLKENNDNINENDKILKENDNDNNGLSVVKKEHESDISNPEKISTKNSKLAKDDTRRKSNLTVLIESNNLKDEKTNLTPEEFADKLYKMEETEYEGKPISLILTETDNFHEETLKFFMEHFDFYNVEIDEALRILCKKLVITGETQQIDRILTQFSKHFFESNPHRHEVFLNEDVTHSIVYSLVLLNTDLHIVYNDNPNKKMTKKEFLKNTMTLLETMTDSASTQTKIKSANIPNNNRRSYFESPSSNIYKTFTSSTLPRNFTESQENKQKRWRKQMEQLLNDLYNSIKTKRILQRNAENDNTHDTDILNSNSNIQSADGPNRIQNLFGNEKSGYSTFSSMKNLISKGTTRRSKEKNIYLSLPTLNASDTASYNSYSDISYSNKSYDKLSTISKSTNGINLGKSSNAIIVQKGALNRKHYLDQGKQRAKDRRWSKAHCAIFIDPTVSANGTCELRIWLESTSTSSSKKKGTTNKDFDDLFESTANEDDIETQNLPYLNPNYHEVLPITHSVTSVIRNYTSFNYTTKKNVFSLKLSNGSTYLFEASDEDTMKTWVNALNFWAARKSKEPLRGGVGNMEYGWNQVEKVEKSKDITPEEILEPIPIYDPFDNAFDSESIKSYSSSNREKTSRPNSIHSARSGRSTNNRNDSNSIKDLNLSSLPEGSSHSIKEERTARSFTIKRFRSSSRSTSRNTELRSTARSISLNRSETETTGSINATPSVRSYSCTRRPSQNIASNTSIDSGHSMPPIPSSNCTSPNSETKSETKLETKSDILPTSSTTTSDRIINSDNQTSPLTKKPMNIDMDDSLDSNDNIPVTATATTNTINTANSTTIHEDNQPIEIPNSENPTNENTIKPEKIDHSPEENIKSLNSLDGEDIFDGHGLLHRRILSEPQLRTKRDIDKHGTKKRSQSLNHYTENMNKSLNSVLPIPVSVLPIPVSPDESKSKLEDDHMENKYMTLPYNRSHKSNVITRKHQSLIPEKLFSGSQRISIQPGSSFTIKKKIKKLRICEWTQPGVGFLLSTLPLEKQYESMKKQYIITEKEIEEHKEIKQPMEDLYVFQSSAYQKACNNWKKKYMYLLDEKNKYGLYVNILENYMKIDPNEENLFTVAVGERKNSKTSSMISHGLSQIEDKPLPELPENKEVTSVSHDEIQSILAKKRQQQLDIMKKTANDLSIDSGKIESSFILPEINVGESLFDDDEYEKEMQELAIEQERIFNINKK